MAKLSVIHANIEPYNNHAGLLEPGTLKQGFASGQKFPVSGGSTLRPFQMGSRNEPTKVSEVSKRMGCVSSSHYVYREGLSC